MQTNKHKLDCSLKRFMPEGYRFVRGLGVLLWSNLLSFPSQPSCILSGLATEIWQTIGALLNPALTEFPDLLAQQIWAMKLSRATRLFSSCQRPDNKTGILFQQTLMSIFLFAQSRQLVAIRDMLVGECVWLQRWHMTGQSWHTGRWRDSTSSIHFQQRKWIKKTILRAKCCLYEWSLM